MSTAAHILQFYQAENHPTFVKMMRLLVVVLFAPLVAGFSGVVKLLNRPHTELFDSEHEPEPKKLNMDFDDEVAKNIVEINEDSAVFGIDEKFITFPSRDYAPTEVLQMCMDGLMENNEPYSNAGIEICWNFSSDQCRAAHQGSFEKFIEFATPAFSHMANAEGWTLHSKGALIEGTATRGPMQSFLVSVVSKSGMEERNVHWVLQRERRPPNQDCWLIQECRSSEKSTQIYDRML